MIVAHVSLRSFRSYPRLELDLPPGLILVTGPNGVGKTNLLEALHVGTQGFSPRTRAEARLVRFGDEAARVAVAGAQGGAPLETEVVIRPGAGKRVSLNRSVLPGAEELRTQVATLAFLPERLAVVKGGPLVRRAYFDRMLGRVLPARSELPPRYARALAQRNAALRRARAGAATLASVAPWTGQVAELGTELDTARAELAALLGSPFARVAASLGLEDAAVRYEARPLAAAELERRLERDLERGVTGAGPHLRDIGISAGGRDLRSFGSQGEQRAAVLALVLAEAELARERRGLSPLLLLDDVFSELDAGRRAALLAALPPGGQTLVTATARTALPDEAPEPALEVEVRPGEARPL